MLLLSLDDALNLAVGESETLWVARAGVMRAVGGRDVARSGLFPQLTGSASYTRTLRSQFEDLSLGGPPDDGSDPGDGEALEDLPFGRPNQYSLGLSLSQLIFDGGQTRALLRAAEARRRSAEIDLDAARAETLLDTTRSYFDALLADRLVEIAEASLAQAEEVLRLTGVAREVGDRSEFELLRSRVARDNQLPAVIARRTQRDEAYLRLKQLLNLPLDSRLQLTTRVDEPVARFATPSTAPPEERAPVRQAEENVEANEEQLRATRSERLPAIVLTSSYAPVAYPASGLPEPDDFRTDWSVTLGLSVPLFTGGRLRGNELVARGNLAEARARLRQTQEAAALDARVAGNDLTAAEATLAGTTSTVEEARRAYEISLLRFREGLASQIELADSRLLLEQAEANRASAQRNVQVARARLALLPDLPLAAAAAAGFEVPAQTLITIQPTTTAPGAPTSPLLGVVPGAAGTIGTTGGPP